VENPIGGGSPEREKPVPLSSEALKRRPEARTREWRWPERRREGGVKAPPWRREGILQRGGSPGEQRPAGGPDQPASTRWRILGRNEALKAVNLLSFSSSEDKGRRI
jgi:hypothetical protein